MKHFNNARNSYGTTDSGSGNANACEPSLNCLINVTFGGIFGFISKDITSELKQQKIRKITWENKLSNQRKMATHGVVIACNKRLIMTEESVLITNQKTEYESDEILIATIRRTYRSSTTSFSLLR